ncbi:MAG: hypothetical protein ACOCXZ_02755 [Chloroflexota bacterium]
MSGSKSSKKSEGNQGIQADRVQAEVMAVGNRAQAIQNNYNTGGDDALTALIAQLQDALRQVPDDKRDDAEAVDALAKEMTQSASAEKPNKKLLEIKGDALKAAAENLKDVVPAVMAIATQIVSHILAM